MGYTGRLLALLALLGPLPPACNSFVEFFAGDAAWSRGLRLLGFTGVSFDARQTLDHDFLTPVGFLLGLLAIMLLHKRGVVLAAPPCSSWVFMSRSSTGRHLDIMGCGSALVEAQNALVARLVYALILCIKRGIYWIVEQPASSILFEHPRWREGHGVGSAPYLGHMERRLTSADRACVQNNGHRLVTADTYVDKQGQKRCNGHRHDLKSTQAYDMGFGSAHALLYKNHLESDATDDEQPPPLIDSDSEIGDDDKYLEDLRDSTFSWKSNIKAEHVLQIQR